MGCLFPFFFAEVVYVLVLIGHLCLTIFRVYVQWVVYFHFSFFVEVVHILFLIGHSMSYYYFSCLCSMGCLFPFFFFRRSCAYPLSDWSCMSYYYSCLCPMGCYFVFHRRCLAMASSSRHRTPL
jgi:hypothetical protein